MRLWSFHPVFLDPTGLVALWRESLLAKKVLEGKTRGYTQHPQLIRFREADNPVEMISRYLQTVYDESVRRGYSFKQEKIGQIRTKIFTPLNVPYGQINYEYWLLQDKLQKRSPEYAERLLSFEGIVVNPVFSVVPGAIAPWEKVIPNLVLPAKNLPLIPEIPRIPGSS